MDIAHEKLSFEGTGATTITEPGYVYIWLSNENETAVEVFFDDFNVTQTQSAIVQQQDYYPFGLKFNSYSRENSLLNKIKLFQGQEHIDDLGLNWDSFKWRNYQSEICRFFNVDPLAEKYVHNSTYAFAENKVITFRELEGLEGVHYMEGEDHVIEKNVVVLVKEQKPIPKDANAATVKKITKENERIGRQNAARVAGVANDLKEKYSGAKNSADQKVQYRFNMTSIPDFDKTGMTKAEINARYKSISMDNGLAGTKSAFGITTNLTAPAAVFTNEGSGSSQGSTTAGVIRMNVSAPSGGISHEILHTLGVEDNGYASGGLLNSPPDQIIPSEVDLTLKNSYERKNDN